MTDRESEDCSGKCLNGGACINGECKCRSGFSGTYCETKIWYILIFTILLAIIGGIIFYTLKIRKDIRNRGDIDDDPNSIIGSNPEPSRKGKYGRN